MCCKTLRKKTTGFTLLEVLVALAILAISLSAVISSVGASANNVSALTDRTVAHWVAMNAIAKIQLDKNTPSLGMTQGDVVMANSDWKWQVNISKTADADVRRLDVTVTQGSSSRNLATLLAYLPI